MNIPPPTQDSYPLFTDVCEYFKAFEIYAMGNNRSLDDPDIRTKFFAGLTLSNQKDFIRFGVKKPLSEIVSHLKKKSDPLKNYIFGEVVQGNDSVALFLAKLRKYNAIINLNEEELKRNFLRGLNTKNQFEVMLCGEDLSLEELVDRLSRLEALEALSRKNVIE